MTNATSELLDELARHYGEPGEPATDYRIAKNLGMTPQRISNWRRGVSGISSERALEFCGIIWPGDARRAAYWITRLQADREQSAEVKAVWQKLANQVAAVILAAGIGLGAMFSPAPAQAIEHNISSPDYRLYAIRRRLRRWLRGILPLIGTAGFFALGGCTTTGQEIAWQTLHAVDVAQTVNGPAGDPCYMEADPLTSAIIGEQPSKTEAVAWGLAWAGMHAGVTWLLDRNEAPQWAQIGWQALTITNTASAVYRNHQAGIRPFGRNEIVNGCR